MASELVFERWGGGDAEQPAAAVRPPVAAPAPSQPTSGITFERWGDAIDDAVKTVGRVAKSVDAGFAKGAAGLVGLPHAVGTLGAMGIDKLTQSIDDYRGVPASERSKPPAKSVLDYLPTAESAQKVIENTFYNGQPLHKPETQGERYAHTVGEFSSGALAGPGGPLGNVIKYGILPGLTSEFAGETAKGMGYGPVGEQIARVGTGVLTGGIAGAVSRPGSTAQAVRQQLPEGVTPQIVNQAQTLMEDAAQRGVTLSWPEALSQVAGRPVLSDMARHLEAAGPTQGRMAEFYGQRPQQVEAAARNQFDNIAPPNMNPHGIGHAAGEVVEGAVHDARGAINTAARPHYTAAQTHQLGAPEMAQVRALPGYEAARDAVRNDPQLARYVVGLPENSVGFLNEVKKQLDYSARNAAAPLGPQGIPNQQRVAGFTSDAAAVRQAGIDATGGATGPYATALGIEEQGRGALERVLQGPIGKIASKDTTTKQAIEALFPRDPLANSEQAITTAVGVLANRSPRIAGDLVRAHVEGTFNEAARSLQTGANQAAGAKFAVQLVGNPQQRANLEAAVTALPNGADRWTGFNRFLEILEATGTRQNVGSKTAYNAEFLKEAASSGVIGETAKGLANPFSRFTAGLIEKYERYRLGNNLNELADILTNPAAVGQLRAIARMPANSPQAVAVAWRLTNLARSGSSTGQPVQQPRQ